MKIPVATPEALPAGKGYDGDRLRESLLIRGILANAKDLGQQESAGLSGEKKVLRYLSSLPVLMHFL